MEDDDQQDRQEAEHLIGDELDASEGIAGFAQQPDKEGEEHDHHGKALDDPSASGSLEEPDDQPDADPNDRQLDQELPGRIAAKELEDVIDPHSYSGVYAFTRICSERYHA